MSAPRLTPRHAALLLTALLAASIPSCGKHHHDFAYCYADSSTCTCDETPSSLSGAVPTCGTHWDFCCQWQTRCECYNGAPDEVTHDGATCLEAVPGYGSLKGTEVVTCGPIGGTGTGGSGGHCTSEEPHTTFASCDKDGDCYSGYCNQSCNPGPCCEIATDTVRDDGRSYDCASDADCAAVAPDFVARGGRAACVRPGNTMVHEVCTFDCPSP